VTRLEGARRSGGACSESVGGGGLDTSRAITVHVGGRGRGRWLGGEGGPRGLCATVRVGRHPKWMLERRSSPGQKGGDFALQKLGKKKLGQRAGRGPPSQTPRQPRTTERKCTHLAGEGASKHAPSCPRAPPTAAPFVAPPAAPAPGSCAAAAAAGRMQNLEQGLGARTRVSAASSRHTHRQAGNTVAERAAAAQAAAVTGRFAALRPEPAAATLIPSPTSRGRPRARKTAPAGPAPAPAPRATRRARSRCRLLRVRRRVSAIASADMHTSQACEEVSSQDSVCGRGPHSEGWGSTHFISFV
jgi:hypothetical protein